MSDMVMTLDGLRYPSKGWKRAKPQRVGERKKVAQACGVKKCFLRPSTRSYPICKKCGGRSCSCRPDCRGLLAAYSRAKANKAWRISAKALRLARRHGCQWARKK